MKVIAWNGEKITKPGLYSGMPIEIYHSDICEGPSISSSGLRAIVNQSPADYWDTSYLNPAAERDDTESKALLLGRAVHHLILGEKNFSAAFSIQPETYVHEKDGPKAWSNNATVCKAWRKAERDKGRTVITSADAEIIKGMAKAMARDELVREGMLNGLMEHSGFWKDKATGLWLKIRPDAIPVVDAAGYSADVVDLKTIPDVDYLACKRSTRDNGYYIQAALIRQGLKAVANIDVATFTLMFAQKKRPFSTRPFICEPDDMDLGDEAIRTGLDVMVRCIKDGVWPGPGRGPGRDLIEKLQLSPYDREEIEMRIHRLKQTFELNSTAAPALKGNTNV